MRFFHENLTIILIPQAIRTEPNGEPPWDTTSYRCKVACLHKSRRIRIQSKVNMM
jgi:hypothetical protein